MFNSFYKTYKQYIDFYYERPFLLLIYFVISLLISTLLGLVLAFISMPINLIRTIIGFFFWKTEDVKGIKDVKDVKDVKQKKD